MVRTALLSCMCAGMVFSAIGEVRAYEPEYYLGGKASTLGLGVEAGAKIASQWAVRLNGNFLNLNEDFETDNVLYKGDVDLRSLGAIADWYPHETGFHVSGGIFYNGNQAAVRGTALRDVRFGGTSYTPDQLGELRAEAEANAIAPYVGIGYQYHVTPAFSVGAELGALYTGQYEATLSATSPAVAQADLREEQRQLDDEVGSMRFWPVLGVRAGYHF